MGQFDAEIARAQGIARQFNEMLVKATKYKEEETALLKSFLDKVDKYQKKLETMAGDASDRVGYIQAAIKSASPWQAQYDSINAPPDKLKDKAKIFSGPPLSLKLDDKKPPLPQIKEALDDYLKDEQARIKKMIDEQDAALQKWNKAAEKHFASINYVRTVATNAPIPP